MFYPWKAVDRQPKAYVPFKTFCQRTFLLYFNKVENVMLWVEQNLTKLAIKSRTNNPGNKICSHTHDRHPVAKYIDRSIFKF